MRYEVRVEGEVVGTCNSKDLARRKAVQRHEHDKTKEVEVFDTQRNGIVCVFFGKKKQLQGDSAKSKVIRAIARQYKEGSSPSEYDMILDALSEAYEAGFARGRNK